MTFSRCVPVRGGEAHRTEVLHEVRAATLPAALDDAIASVAVVLTKVSTSR